MRKAIGLAVLFAVCCPAMSFAEDSESWLTTQDAIDTSQKFSVCAGLFEALSVTTESWGKENSAKFLHESHNGAQVVAMWFLAIEHEQRTGDAKPIGDFAVHVEGLVESSATYFLALIDNGGITEVQEDMNKCAALNELQTAVIKFMRTSAILQSGQSGE